MPRLRQLAGRNARRRGGAAFVNSYYTYATGGGSGEIYTQNYKIGAVLSVTIGAGGSASNISIGSASGERGGTTVFGDLILEGGFGGYAWGSQSDSENGAASGSIATAGGEYTGGYGNKNNTSQTYGNGGDWSGSAFAGQAGAVILTYLGR